MTQPKHTPGPWKVCYNDGSLIMAPQSVRIGDDIAEAKMNSFVTFDVMLANAHLIAAAPMMSDLLAAVRTGLHKALDEWAEKYGLEPLTGCYAEAREQALDAATQKARGQQ